MRDDESRVGVGLVPGRGTWVGSQETRSGCCCWSAGSFRLMWFNERGLGGLLCFCSRANIVGAGQKEAAIKQHGT